MCSVFLSYFTFCFIVPDPTPITGMQASVVPRDIASSGSDVFVCEEARDTPAARVTRHLCLLTMVPRRPGRNIDVMQSVWRLRSCTTTGKKV